MADAIQMLLEALDRNTCRPKRQAMWLAKALPDILHGLEGGGGRANACSTITAKCPMVLGPFRCQEGVHLRFSEIIAQVLPLTAFASFLPTLLAFIDNQTGEAALKKGYEKDEAVNGVFTAFWALAVRQTWDPDFKRVSFEANISHAVSRADLQFAQEPSALAGATHVPETGAGQFGHRPHAVDQAASDLTNISASWSEPALSALRGAPAG